MQLTKRSMMTALLAAAATHVLPGLSRAQARRFATATLTGSWEVAYREVLVPAFRKANNDADIVLDALIGLDQLAKVSAARSNPPLDTMLLDPGPSLAAMAQGLVEPFPADKSKHYADINPDAKTEMGVAPFFLAVGIAYNPERIKTPPTSWADLWKPEYKGRVGITTMQSTPGTAFVVEAARMRGGSESNIDEGFKALAELKPSLSAVAANPSQLAVLFQQGQIDIGPAVFNEITLLKARGVPVDFAVPKEKAIGYTSTFYIVKNSPYQELAFKLIEAALSPEVQTKLMEDPYLVIPTNTKVKVTGEVARIAGSDIGKIKERLNFQDWKTINAQRGAWIERFNREMRI